MFATVVFHDNLFFLIVSELLNCSVLPVPPSSGILCCFHFKPTTSLYLSNPFHDRPCPACSTFDCLQPVPPTSLQPIPPPSIALLLFDDVDVFQKTLVKSLFGGVITNNVVSLVSWLLSIIPVSTKIDFFFTCSY